MMSFKRIPILIFAALFLPACAPQGEVQHDPEETALYLTDEPPSVTLHARLINEETRPTDPVHIDFETTDDAVLDSLEPGALDNSREEIPSIDGGEGYIVSITLPLSDSLTVEEIIGSIDGYVLDEEGEEIHRFTFDEVEEA